MKKNRLAASALALAVSITACDCGDRIYELTEEEEAVIVHYSAHAVSKFNKRQSEGIQDVAVLKALKELREKEALERRKQREEEEKERQRKLGQQTEDDKNNKDNKDSNQNGQLQKPNSSQNAGQTNPSGEQQPNTSYVSLKKALQLSGINAVYRSYELVPSYQASQSYMVRASSGNELLVLHVNLKNSGSKTAECDILSKMPSFQLTVNGDVSVSADTTILLNDLGTYQGKIRAGEKARTVLIFQVKKGEIKSMDNMDLEVTVNGEASLVHLAG